MAGELSATASKKQRNWVQYIRLMEEKEVLWKELHREKTSSCIWYVPRSSYSETLEVHLEFNVCLTGSVTDHICAFLAVRIQHRLC